MPGVTNRIERSINRTQFRDWMDSGSLIGTIGHSQNTETTKTVSLTVRERNINFVQERFNYYHGFVLNTFNVLLLSEKKGKTSSQMVQDIKVQVYNYVTI